MPHAFMYHGGFELNRQLLAPGATTFKGTDGADHALPQWPAEVTGVRVGYMEKPGKRFAGVRVLDDHDDVVLEHEVLVDPSRHLGPGKRFGGEPTIVGDEAMREFLKDAIRKNADQKGALEAIRDRAKGG